MARGRCLQPRGGAQGASTRIALVGRLVPMFPVFPLAAEGTIQLQPPAGTPWGFLGAPAPVMHWVTTINPGSPRLKLGACVVSLERGPGPPACWCRLLPCPVLHWFKLGLTGDSGLMRDRGLWLPKEQVWGYAKIWPLAWGPDCGVAVQHW